MLAGVAAKGFGFKQRQAASCSEYDGSSRSGEKIIIKRFHVHEHAICCFASEWQWEMREMRAL